MNKVFICLVNKSEQTFWDTCQADMTLVNHMRLMKELNNNMHFETFLHHNIKMLLDVQAEVIDLLLSLRFQFDALFDGIFL